MTDYKLTTGSLIVRVSDGAFIPPDPANRDRQDYETWLAAGNEPDPADPPPPVVKTIPPLDWMARFTAAEQAAVFGAAQSKPQVLGWIAQTAAAAQLTLDDGTGKPDGRIKAGIDGLVAAGILTPGRAAEILTPP
jgi:hypothetical protein